MTGLKVSGLTGLIIGCAMEVHTELGPGMLESAYEACLKYELEQNGLCVQQQLNLPIIYKEVKLEKGYKIDLLVENKVVIELKTVDKILNVHEAQILSYMKLGNYPVGLLMNFKVNRLKHGIKRFAMG